MASETKKRLLLSKWRATLVSNVDKIVELELTKNLLN